MLITKSLFNTSLVVDGGINDFFPSTLTTEKDICDLMLIPAFDAKWKQYFNGDSGSLFEDMVFKRYNDAKGNLESLICSLATKMRTLGGSWPACS